MFGFINKGLGKTAEAIKHIAPKKKLKISKDELEDILLETDVEYELVEIILREIYTDEVSREQLESKLLTTLAYSDYKEPDTITSPCVDLIIGVNGAGKTTTIAKLAARYKNQGERVVLGASDTFRAAAIEQLTQWAKRLDVPIVSSKQGHDPSAVAYDAIESAKAKGFEHVIIDTAGRLHTQTNLANELKKIVRICDKAHTGAPHRKILVLDGTQGSSAIAQAKAFHEMIDLDAIIITKLDGTARGGSLFSIAYELKIPILYIGVGEQPEHLLVFDKYEFVSGLLDIIYFDEDEVPPQVTQLSEDDTVHISFEEKMKRLNKRIHDDGFDLLSKHFVREQSTWNEYRFAKNETTGEYEILERDGSVLRSYNIDAF